MSAFGDGLVPSQTYRRTLEDGDECIGHAGGEHDEGDKREGEREFLHLGGEDAEIEEKESRLGEEDRESIKDLEG